MLKKKVLEKNEINEKNIYIFIEKNYKLNKSQLFEMYNIDFSSKNITIPL